MSVKVVSSASDLRSAEKRVMDAAKELRDDLIRLPVDVLKPEERALIEAVDCLKQHQEARHG